MTRRRASTLAEVLTASAILAVTVGMMVVALSQSSLAGQRALLASQARRLLERDLEQARSGGGIPGSGTSGPFTISVSIWTPGGMNIVGGTPIYSPDCYGASGCSNSFSQSSVSSMRYALITISDTTDGAVLASGFTVTPP